MTVAMGKHMWDIAADIWHPSRADLEESNLAGLIRHFGLSGYDEIARFALAEPDRFWSTTAELMGVRFDPAPTAIVDQSRGLPWAHFFPGAGFNFAARCIEPADGPVGGDQPAIIWENESGDHATVSYAELAARTRAVAAGLLAQGVKAGDRVGLLFPNTPEAVIAFLAIGYIGALSVPLYSGFGADAVARRLIDSEASCLIAATGFVRRGKHYSLEDVARTAIGLMPVPPSLVIVGDSPGDGHVRWADMEATDGRALAPAATLATDPFMVIYTSGTSGKPKGAVHAHAGFPLRVAQDVCFLFDFRPGDRFFWFSDMGWMVGPFSICSTLLLKGALVLYDGAPNAPDISRLRAVAARSGTTHFGSTPTAIRAMAAEEATVLAVNAPSIRVLLTGGEVMDADTHRWFFKAFGRGTLPILNYSGGTEVSGALLSNVMMRDLHPCRFNSVALGVSAGLYAEGQLMPTGEEGELGIDMPFNGKCLTFWQDAKRYLEAYWSKNPNIWMHGDLAKREEDGQYLIIGRTDDVMKISGKRVGPSEVEGVITEDPRIAEAVAFSVPDARSGEAMILFVVPAAGTAWREGELSDHVSALLRGKMGPSYKPSMVVGMEKLMRTKNGKLVRRLAKQAWLGLEAGDLTAVDDPDHYAPMRDYCRTVQDRKVILT
jgi:acetyl-CoA synthetase